VSNQSPVSDAGADQTVYVGDSVTLNGSGSFDPDGVITGYAWNFGDSTSASGIIVNHVYNTAAASPPYTVNLTVTDDQGDTGSDATFVTVNEITEPVVDLNSGLVAYYPFNGNANDESGNGNDGTVFGATLTTDRFGNSNSAYNFDGVNDYIKADASSLPTQERSVSFWFNADIVTNHPGLLGYGGGGSGPPGTSWLMQLNNTSIPGSFQMNSHWNTHTIDYFYDSDPIEEWYHWTITTSAAGTKLYVNGIVKASNNDFVSNTFVANTDLSFGSIVSTIGVAPYVDPNVSFFDGKIDDVHIYDRAINSTEIQLLYNGSTPSNNNQPPVANAGADQTATVGDSLTFNGSGSFDSDGTLTGYVWNFGDGASSSGMLVNHIYSSASASEPYAVNLTVTDNNGATGTDTAFMTINAFNHAPFADAGPDQFVSVGDTVAFDGSGSSDLDGTITGYVWNFGDGTSSSGMLVNHIYNSSSASGLYTVNLTVTDNDGATGSDTAILNVDGPNQAPVANAGPDQSADVGDTVAFDGSGSSDLDGTITGYVWNFGDGASSSGMLVNHIYSSASASGLYTINLTVTDDEGVTGNDTAFVSINDVSNQPPVANAGADQSANVGDTVTFNGSGSSDSDGVITGYAWNFGDGTSSSGIIVNHVYISAAASPYTVNLTVTDDEGAAANDTAFVTITDQGPNQTPVADAGPDKSANVGDTVTFNGSGSSDSDGVITGYAWNFGDGTSSSGIIVNHVYNSAAASPPYTVNLMVTDDQGATGNDTALVTINGPGPTVITTGGLVGFTQIIPADGGEHNPSTTYNVEAGTTPVGSISWSDTFVNSLEMGPDGTIGLSENPYIGRSWSDQTGSITYDLSQLDVSAFSNVDFIGLEFHSHENLLSTGFGTLVLKDGITVLSTINLVASDQFGPWSFMIPFNDFNASSKILTVDMTLGTAQHGQWHSHGVALQGTPVSVPPVADVGADQTVFVGDSVIFNGSGSFDPDGGVITGYAWNFGDGTSASGIIVNHVYNSAAASPYTVNLTVTDDEGATGNDTMLVTVNDVPNQPPIANAGADQSVNVGDTVTFNGSGSSDSDGVITGYAWNFGDGISASGIIVNHVYNSAAASPYTVNLTVTDDEGATGNDTAFVTVMPNQLPVANAGADQSVTVGDTVTFNGSGSSDSDGVITGYAWDFGDGTSSSGMIVNHVYNSAAASPYTVNLTVTDDEGATGNDTAFVTVTIEDNDGDGVADADDIDDDNDGIADVFDTQSFVFSSVFLDSRVGGTGITGQVVDRSGHNVTVNPGSGVITISVDNSGGINPAKITASGVEMDILPGTTVELSSGSLIINIITGSATVAFVDDGGSTVTIELVTDDNVTIDTIVFTIENNGSGTLTVSVDGEEIDIEPGQTLNTFDDDSDGVNNTEDQCPGTPTGETVDVNGCSATQLDDDNDGVNNADDQCPGADDAIDIDNDGIPDCIDQLIDVDGDGVADADDNCPSVSNPGQADCDEDGIGDVCDTSDSLPPIALAKDISIQLNEEGSANITAAEVDNGSNDTCSAVTLSVSQSTFECSNIGPNAVTLTVTDNNGNSSMASATVTVEDNMDPTITAPADSTVECTGDTRPVANGTATGSDNCGVAITYSDASVGGCGNTEVITRTWTATDPSGNSTSADQAITVVDTTAPTVTAQLVSLSLKKKKGCFRVEFSATDNCNDEAGLSAVLNGYPVSSGQLVELKHKKRFKVKVKGEGSSDDDSSGGRRRCAADVRFEGPDFTLNVTATDACGNAGNASDDFVFAGGGSDDDSGSGNKKKCKKCKKWKCKGHDDDSSSGHHKKKWGKKRWKNKKK
jgi:chitodextrinase